MKNGLIKEERRGLPFIQFALAKIQILYLSLNLMFLVSDPRELSETALQLYLYIALIIEQRVVVTEII